MITKINQILILTSATIIMVTLGSIYTFAVMMPYISSYLYYRGNQASQSVLSIVYTIAPIAKNFGLFIDSVLDRYLSNKKICIIALLSMSTCIFISSFMDQVIGFIIFFGILNGITIGIGYTCPLRNAYAYFPNQKGFCAGCCMAGFGFGSVIFNQVIFMLINPENKQVDPITHKFPQQVANHVPFAFKILALIYLSLGTIGLLMMKQNKTIKQQIQENQVKVLNDEHKQSIIQDQQNKNYQQKSINPIKLFFDKKGGYLYIFIICLIQFPNLIAFAYKQIAFALNPNFYDQDYQLTIIGTIGIFGNGLSRYIWGFLSDYFSIQSLLTVVNLILIIITFTIKLTSLNLIAYGFVVFISYICVGALYTLIPALVTKIFGPKLFGKIYWLPFFGFSAGLITRFLCQTLIINNTQGSYGYLLCSYIFGGFQLISLIVIILVNFEKQSDNLQKNLLD